MPLTVSYMKRRLAAPLYNLTSLPLSLTKTTTIFRLSFNGESVTAIKSSLFLCMSRNNLGKAHLTQAPPTFLVKHSKLI